MSFRKISLVFITLLLTTVLLFQWIFINKFTQDVSKTIGESAFEVSRSTAESLMFDQPRFEMHTLALTTEAHGSIAQNQQIQNQFKRIVKGFKQDITIQLLDEKKDDFILLNADGSEYQIPIPRTGLHTALDSFSNNVLYATFGLLFFGILMAIYFTKKLSSPLKELQFASNQIGDGNLGTQVNSLHQWNSTEIEDTIRSFNEMSTKIEQLQKQNEILQSKAHLAELAEISRGLAHTIRNPLNTLNLAIDQLADTNDQSARLEMLKMAKHQISRIDKWIRSLMDIMSNDSQLTKEVKLSHFVDSIISDQKLSQSKKLSFSFDNQIAADADQLKVVEPELKSIVQSLLSNAVEASKEDGNIKIKLSKLNNESDNYCIQITDDGCGFSEKVLNNLFTPHNTDKTYGAGMGLYLAYQVVKLKYNGNIIIENLKPKGAHVKLILSHRLQTD